MRFARVLLAVALALPAAPSVAADEEEGWSALNYALTLIQTLVRIGAHSDNPQQGFDDLLAGRNTEANRAIAGLLEEATADMPAQHKEKVTSIGRDLAALARKQSSGAAAVSTEGSLQARKDLHAMGLTYYDKKQYLDAVQRGDKLAVELFVAARGLPDAKNPPAAR